MVSRLAVSGWKSQVKEFDIGTLIVVEDHASSLLMMGYSPYTNFPKSE